MDKLSSSQILSITSKKLLFGDDQTENYRRLRSIWHPDRKGGSATVFAHIQQVWEGTLKTKTDCRFIKTHDSTVQISAIRSTRLIADGMEEIITRKHRWMIFSESCSDLDDARIYQTVSSAASLLKNKSQIPNADAKKATELLLPEFRQWLLPNHGRLLKWDIEGFIKLSDSYEHLLKLPETARIWIVSRMLSLIILVETAEKVSLSLLTDSFINPEKHDLKQFGGLEFFTQQNEKIKFWPADAELACSPKDLAQPASFWLHRLQVRWVARRLFYPKFPSQLMKWLVHGTADRFNCAVSDAKLWYDVLKAQYGERKFIPTPLEFDTVYPPKP